MIKRESTVAPRHAPALTARPLLLVSRCGAAQSCCCLLRGDLGGAGAAHIDRVGTAVAPGDPAQHKQGTKRVCFLVQCPSGQALASEVQDEGPEVKWDNLPTCHSLTMDMLPRP